jgi:hypothetical protein
MISAWFARMNRRERTLTLAVAAILFLLINIAVWSTLLGMSSDLRNDWATQNRTRREQKVYLDSSICGTGGRIGWRSISRC